jgi:hypothetical protein
MEAVARQRRSRGSGRRAEAEEESGTSLSGEGGRAEAGVEELGPRRGGGRAEAGMEEGGAGATVDESGQRRS